LFFCSANYNQALSSLAIVFTILSRIANKENNLNDLFTIYLNTFSKDKFNFYLENHLPKVLSTYHNKQALLLYNEALALFKKNPTQKLEKASEGHIENFLNT
jgi:hypothetical protein